MGKRYFVLLCLLLLPMFVIRAEEPINKVKFYTDLGGSTLYGFNAGLSGLYTRQMSGCLELTGGLNFSSKRPSFFNAALADATLKWDLLGGKIGLSNRVMYTHYSDSKMNDFLYRIAAQWNTRYFHVTLGNSFIYTFSRSSSFFEYIIPAFGMYLTLKPSEHHWNVGAFIRNYDDFVYENYNVFLGIDGQYKLNNQWTLNAELTTAPAGTLSQLATAYRTFVKLGATYIW